MLAAHPEGQRVIDALGPWGRDVVARLKTVLGAELDEIDAVLVAIVVGPDGELDVCFRATLVTAWTDEEIAARFPGSTVQQQGGRSLFIQKERAYFLTAASSSSGPADNRMLIACPARLAAELVASSGESPALVRDIEALAELTDADRVFTAVIAPKFLQASGNELLADSAAPLHDALHWLLGTDAAALSLSAHWDDNFFAELRAVPTLNVPPRRLAAKLRERIAAAPSLIEDDFLSAPWHPHGRKILARFPAMLRALVRYSRAGDEERQAVLRAYLPPGAGHNLLMAAELLLTQPRHVESAPAGQPSPSAKPATLEERIAQPGSLSFSKESLERALELLAEDTGIEIVIQGGDLQLDGITKNQSLGLQMRDRPVREILVEILLKANPDRAASGPADPRQKLVYTIERAKPDDAGRIIVTTRAAAEKRNLPLPDVFLVKDR
jgi:hypothetical protein